MKLLKGIPLSFILPFVLGFSCPSAFSANPGDHILKKTEVTAICKDSLEVYLAADGYVSIDPSDIDDGSFDAVAPSDPLSFFLSQDLFDCTEIGYNTVELAAIGNSGQGNCFSQVIVLDTLGPVLTCTDMTFALPSDGNLNLDISDFLLSAQDNCSIDSYLMNQSDYNCSDIGENTVTLSVSDGEGNNSTCTSILTIVDDQSPVPQCQDILVELDTMGSFTLSEFMVNTGVTDNCVITDVSISPMVLDCSHVGTLPVEVIATDNAGNTGICFAFVEVIDDVAPEVLCQDIEIELEADLVSIVLADVYLSSFDACGIYSLTISEERFYCSDIGANEVSVLAYDNNGNAEACSAIVNVVDAKAPTALCKDIFIDLQAGEELSIDASWLDAGSFDNCMVDSMEISQRVFNCFDRGENIVQLSVWDPSGNEASCQAVVDVRDNYESLRNMDFIEEDFIQLRLGESYAFNISDPLVDGVSYYWYPNDYLSCSDCLNPELSVLEDIQYTFVVEDEDGCLSINDQVLVNLRYDEPAFIPNVFSPNGDGVNDYFEVYPSIMIDQVKTMRIYDRWGNLVYHGQGANPRWDGSQNGKMRGNGVFLYEVELVYIDGQSRWQQGSVNLVE